MASLFQCLHMKTDNSEHELNIKIINDETYSAFQSQAG